MMMKLRKALSAAVLGAGCAAAFTGLLSLILPAIANDQLRLVLSSFELPSHNPVVNSINACMSFALHHAWQVFLTGLVTAVIGGILFSLFLKEPPKKTRQDLYRRPASMPRPEPREPASAPDPFADMALWDRRTPEPVREMPKPEEPVFSVFNPTPILEPNRIAEEPAQPLYQPEPEAVLPPPIVPVQMDETPAMQYAFEISTPEPVKNAVQPAMIPKVYPDDPYANDPRFEPNEEEPAPVSTRIRSTMGKHS